MVRYFLSLLLVLVVATNFIMHDAYAKRFGGGRSFGVQRSYGSYNRSNFNSGSLFNQSRPAFNQQGFTASKWLGPLAGFAAGGLLATLFMHHGVGSGLFSWLLIGGLIFLAFNLIRNRLQPNFQPRYDEPRNFTQEPSSAFMQSGMNPIQGGITPNQANFSQSYPLGFDTSAFLRNAKLLFIRLQAAYDQKNLDDLREFTTPEVYSEIQLQFHERGDQENKTDVITLDAEMLDASENPQTIGSTEMQTQAASVRFSGLIQENRNEAASPFNEVWHFKKDVATSRWLVAGIQQH